MDRCDRPFKGGAFGGPLSRSIMDQDGPGAVGPVGRFGAPPGKGHDMRTLKPSSQALLEMHAGECVPPRATCRTRHGAASLVLSFEQT